jgi:hypothetical protein
MQCIYAAVGAAEKDHAIINSRSGKNGTYRIKAVHGFQICLICIGREYSGIIEFPVRGKY